MRAGLQCIYSMNVVLYHDGEGGAEARDIIRKHEFYFETAKVARMGIYKFNVLVTTPHALISDWNVFHPIRWRYVVIDEAHNLKNSDSLLASHIQVPEKNVVDRRLRLLGVRTHPSHGPSLALMPCLSSCLARRICDTTVYCC